MLHFLSFFPQQLYVTPDTPLNTLGKYVNKGSWISGSNKITADFGVEKKSEPDAHTQ